MTQPGETAFTGPVGPVEAVTPAPASALPPSTSALPSAPRTAPAPQRAEPAPLRSEPAGRSDGECRPRVQRARVPMLDVLRGTAVLAVFVQHLGDRFRPFVAAELAILLPTALVSWIRLALERAHWGVDLFFVLSGFTLGLGFSQDHARNVRRTPIEFFARRAARVLPGFYVALLVYVLARPALLSQPQLPSALLWHALVLQGYYSPGGVTIIGASWSLTTECHFYLAAPWVSQALVRRSGAPSKPRDVRRLGLLVFAICATVWTVRGILHDVAILPTSPAGMLELTQRKWVTCRIDQFCLGVGAAVIRYRYAHRIVSRGLVGAGLLAFGACLLAITVPLDARTWAVSGGNLAYACVSVGMTLLVLGAATLPDRTRWWSAPFRALGVISYGVFLYHQLALELVPRWIARAGRTSWDGLLWTLAPSLVLSCAMGAASWYLVEAPALARVSAWLRDRTRAHEGRSAHVSASG